LIVIENNDIIIIISIVIVSFDGRRAISFDFGFDVDDLFLVDFSFEKRFDDVFDFQIGNATFDAQNEVHIVNRTRVVVIVVIV
jgi:hypothetical protein